ncbi:MAG: DUF4230 domain-containing protein [Oscillospiraceae bacterium]|jgi:hypothetical protein|nr:DUF4230 domain-containing protein [Oscillospiraceae bacterium]
MNTRIKRPLYISRALKRTIITIAATAAAVSLIFFFSGRVTRSGGSPQVTSTVVKERILHINELSTVKYMYTNVGKFSKANDFYGYEIPFTTKSFLITYDGTIKAGVDMSRAQVQVNDHAITLTLPAAKVLSHEIDEKSIEVYNETKNIFNPISVKDYTDFAANEKIKMEQKATSEGLLKEAAQKAKSNLTELLQGTAGERKIIIKEAAVSSSATNSVGTASDTDSSN